MRQLVFVCILAVIIAGSLALCQGWHSYTTSNCGITSNRLTAVTLDGDGRIYVGTEASGLSVVYGVNWTTYTKANSEVLSDRIKALACDSGNRIWIGTDVGLSMLDGGEWESFTTANSGLAEDWVVSIAIGPDDLVWVGTHAGGICSFDGATWETFDVESSGLPSDSITSLSVGGNGELWVGTKDAGASILINDEWTVFDQTNTLLMSDHINGFGACRSGVIWVGTPNGLCSYDNGYWEDRTSLIFDADARAIVIDDFGFRWFGLRSGITRFDGDYAVDFDVEVANACVTSTAVRGGHVLFGTRDHGLCEYRYGANLPPTMPSTPYAPDTGNSGVEVEFETSAEDPEGDDVLLQFDFDDGTLSDWGPAIQAHTYESIGTYRVAARAKDENGNVSGLSESHTIVISVGNRPPYKPTPPNGPVAAYIGQNVQFSTSSYDPDGDEMEYMFNWGDGALTDWGAAQRSHAYEAPGTFQVIARARDVGERLSTWSDAASIVITMPNQAPSQPTVPSGPGLVDAVYVFSTSAEDPEGDDVEFLFDWGDGSDSGWGTATATHYYRRADTYFICAIAGDEHGAESTWSEYHSIAISGSAKPIIELSSNRATYYTGQTVKLFGSLINDLDELDVDIYVAARFPWDDTLLFYPSFSDVPQPIRLTLAAQSEFGPYNFFEYVIENPIPVGTYAFFGAVVSPGTQFEFLSEVESLFFDYAGDATWLSDE